MNSLLAAAEQLEPALIATRRDLHQHPELAFEEQRTAGVVSQRLTALGLEVQAGVGGTGVVGILEGDQPGPTLLVRADMDALPIVEDTNAPYASTVPGKMHACGHDGHTAIALGLAELLSERRGDLRGRVKFVFQPAEEIGRGAKAMIADGVLQDPRPDVSIGLHLWNSLPFGTVSVVDGPIMAGDIDFDIVITGRGGHAALPSATIDPTVCAAAVVLSLQTIVSRNIDAFDTAVVSVTALYAGGTAHNVIPQQAELRGTIRYFRDEIGSEAVRRLTDITTHIAQAYNCTADVQISPLTAPVVNSPDVAAVLRQRFAGVRGVEQIDTTTRSMGAEDVGMLMRDIPGTYFFVGARDDGADAYYPHHHPRFTFDERALLLGLKLLAEAASAYVLPD